ncbi:kinesin KIN-7K, chloroplastic isoform X1 [Olea europaea subsp. europaea]|uniref:Kinesin-like protein n=2 Tax=Olea europaea subsp. europaea TaxID=158383 RepID=A0A8S0UCT6_OLEEU|nr:kinesin KIN-7K, chloroplastic isoform X1 [Olea europaea subsp. europaea]
MTATLGPLGSRIIGTFVEGIKEEVVLSPAHALSLIAAGEEHRHVGSTNFNLLSSRSHTIFTLTIESSPYGENCEGEAVTLSQLNLIDLAGSESSKAETTGVRRKEGSYINKSLLTLGTVISKLTDGRSAHVPYRDSKLTRLLQSSLSGQGRVSLICTVTPSSSNSEETHNTLKFAHRAKHIEIQASQNKIIDEKSLIKKYQTEIRCLKEELEKLRRGIVTVPQAKDTGGDDILLLKQKLEDGQVRLQSRLEQEEEAKAALMGRIQRLTKLILVSTKASPSSRIPHRPGPRRRHSFGEEELAYLPHRRRDLILDDENDLNDSLDGSAENTDDTLKEEKRPKKNGLLKWLKLRKRDSGTGTFASSSDKSSGMKSTKRMKTSSLMMTFWDESPLTSMKTMDQIDLLREQQKILSGEVALHTSALKRLSEEAAQNPRKEHPQAEMSKLNEEIRRENEQIASLASKLQIALFLLMIKRTTSKNHNCNCCLMLQSVSELMEQLNEKSFELEVKAADNRIIQEQLNQKIMECKEYQETITTLRQQLSDTLEPKNCSPLSSHSQRFLETKGLQVELHTGKKNAVLKDGNGTLLLQAQANEIEELKGRVTLLIGSKEELELRNNKLAEESSYAKGLASAAAVELKALSEEVAKLMKHNEKLAGELEVQKNSPTQRRNTISNRNGRRDSHVKRHEQSLLASDMKREMALSREKELSYEAALAEKDQREADLHRKVEESKQREAYLENELANMWVLVAKLKKSQGVEND